MTDPVFVYDDDCGFCTWWADYFGNRTDLRIVGFSEMDGDLRDQLPTDYESCSHVVTPETVYSCGASIEEALLRTTAGAVLRRVAEGLRRLWAYRALREWVYRRGANNREMWGKLLSRRPPAPHE